MRDNKSRKKSESYWRENKVMVFFLAFLFAVNTIIFLQRIYYYRNFKMLNNDSINVFYLMSRANGM